MTTTAEALESLRVALEVVAAAGPAADAQASAAQAISAAARNAAGVAARVTEIRDQVSRSDGTLAGAQAAFAGAVATVTDALADKLGTTALNARKADIAALLPGNQTVARWNAAANAISSYDQATADLVGSEATPTSPAGLRKAARDAAEGARKTVLEKLDAFVAADKAVTDAAREAQVEAQRLLALDAEAAAALAAGRGGRAALLYLTVSQARGALETLVTTGLATRAGQRTTAKGELDTALATWLAKETALLEAEATVAAKQAEAQKRVAERTVKLDAAVKTALTT